MSSYDIVGSKEKAVAIVEIREGDGKQIAESILKESKSVKSVLKKASGREGDYRTMSYELIAGDPDTEVVHKEHGYSILVDPQKAFFSVREGTDRQRIAKSVKPGEVVMVMFAGVGPYAIAIGKAQPEVEKVIAVEINPDAVEYMRHNIRVNKLSHKIVPVLGDAMTECEKWYGKCDRVVMPLPMSATSFLDVAVRCVKKGGVVHLYSSGSRDYPYKEAETAVDESLKNAGREYRIIGRRIVLPYSPSRHKVCIDVEVF